MIRGNAVGLPIRLPGNTDATKKYLSQTGDGTNSDTPIWSAISVGEVSGAVSALTGEVSTTGSGSLNVTLGTTAVTGKLLTGLSITSGAITSSDSILSAFGKVQGQINGLAGGSTYKGSWNANTNTPTIVSGTGTTGDYYIVSTAGTTTIDGVSSWDIGDWIIFSGTVWQKIDNTDSVISVNGQVGSVVLTTANITENTNLYYTDTRARGAISLTTSGSSGASTYTSGVLNVPNYTLLGLGGASSSTTLTINGTSYDLSASRTWSVGTVTSVALSVPTGLTISGSPITSSGTLAITLTAGYSIPTTSSQTNWDAAYNDKINSASVTGTTTKTLTLNQQDGGTITTSWTDINTNDVTSVNGFTGAVTLTTSNISEGTNLYYTDTRVDINSNVAANTAARHNAVTLGTANGLSLSTQQLSLALASSSTTGALSSTDWATFNSKQNALTNPITGTGTTNYIPKFTGSTSLGDSIIAESSGIATIYGAGQVYTQQAGAGQSNFYISNEDTTAAINHQTIIATQQAGSGLSRTLIYAAAYSSNKNRGELGILSENGSQYIANFGTILSGGDNAFSLVSTSGDENVRLNTGGVSWLMGGNVGIGTNNPQQPLQVEGGNGIGIGTGGGAIYPVLRRESTSGGLSISIYNTISTAYTDRITALGTGQLKLNAYTSSSSFSGTIAGLLAFDSSGNIITTNLDGIGGVPTSRTITINGTTQDLSANRTFSVGTVTSVGLSSATSGVTIGSTPITTSGTITLSIATASGTQNGLLSSTDWNTFNNKQNTLTNPITGTGTNNFIPKFSGSTTLSNSIISEGTNIINIGQGGSASEYALQLGDSRSGNGFAYIDLIGDTTYTDYGMRLIRSNGGANTTSSIEHRGTGDFIFKGVDASAIKFQTGSTDRMVIDNAGRVGINVTPSYTFQVNGSGYFSDNVRFPNTKGILLENVSGVATGSIKMGNSVTNNLEITNGTNTIYLLTLGVATNSNLLVGATSIGTSATNTIAVVNGTAPSSSATDIFHLYSQDITAGNAAPHFRTENGAVIKLYQETTSVGNAIFSQGGGNSVLDDSTFDGYTLRQVIKALRNQGILA
jgi:hypothetical protein